MTADTGFVHVTDCVRQGKRPNEYYMLCCGDEPAGAVDGDGLYLLSLKPEQTVFPVQLDRELLSGVIRDAERRIARSRAFYLLSLRDYSSPLLREKLAELLPVAPDAIEAAVAAVVEYGYVNDRTYAARIARSLAAAGYGCMRIRDELRCKKFPRAETDGCLNTIAAEFDFPGRAAELLEKKLPSAGQLPEYPQKQKLTAFLARRGFSYDEIGCAWELWEQKQRSNLN